VSEVVDDSGDDNGGDNDDYNNDDADEAIKWGTITIISPHHNHIIIPPHLTHSPVFPPPHEEVLGLDVSMDDEPYTRIEEALHDGDVGGKLKWYVCGCDGDDGQWMW
jgi:hypothetical protein